VYLHSNSIVDLSSLAWSFQVVYGTQAAAGVMVPPMNAEGLIQRLAVEVNGQTLVNLTNYNDLFHVLLNMTATEDYQRQRMIAQTNISSTAAATPTTNGTTQNLVLADGANAASTRRHTIDTWLGFLGSMLGSEIDTTRRHMTPTSICELILN